MSQIPHQHRHSSHLDRNRSNFVKTPSSADFKVAPVPARPVEGLWEPPWALGVGGSRRSITVSNSFADFVVAAAPSVPRASTS